MPRVTHWENPSNLKMFSPQQFIINKNIKLSSGRLYVIFFSISEEGSYKKTRLSYSEHTGGKNVLIMDLYKNKTRLYVIINWISHEDKLLHFLQKVLLHKPAIVVKVLARLDQYDQRDNHDK